MQATDSKRSSVSFYVAAIGVIGALSVATIVLVLSGFGGVGRDAQVNVAPAVAPQAIVTSDALYSLEAAHDMVRTHGPSAQIITSDALYALEANQMAQQQTVQAGRQFITSDALFALEAAHDMTRTYGPSVQPVTSDSLFAIEAEQVARQIAAQADRMTITSDEAFAFEETLAELNRR